MEIRVYRRADDALVVVPALFQAPVAMSREGALRFLGTADVELALLSDALVANIGLYGYAVAQGVDEALVRPRVRRPAMDEPAPEITGAP